LNAFIKMITFFKGGMWMTRKNRCQTDDQKPWIEEGQTIRWLPTRRKDKQKSTSSNITITPVKNVDESRNHVRMSNFFSTSGTLILLVLKIWR
jgi:hypothetical protein